MSDVCDNLKACPNIPLFGLPMTWPSIREGHHTAPRLPVSAEHPPAVFAFYHYLSGYAACQNALQEDRLQFDEAVPYNLLQYLGYHGKFNKQREGRGTPRNRNRHILSTQHTELYVVRKAFLSAQITSRGSLTGITTVLSKLSYTATYEKQILTLTANLQEQLL